MELIQSVYLKPMLDLLSHSGAPVERHLRAVGLDNFKTHDTMAFLPASLVFDFFDRVNKAELSSNLLSDLGDAYRIENMAHWGKTIMNAPNMMTAAIQSTRPEMSIISFNRIDLVIDGAVTTIIDRYDIVANRALRMTEELSSCLLLDSLAQFGGAGCQPFVLDVTGDSVPENCMVDLSRSRVRLRQPELRVSFPTSWLSHAPKSKANGAPKKPDWGPGTSLTERVLLLFDGMESGSRPTLDFLLKCTGQSRRALQRRLEDEDTTFFELVDGWAMVSALKQIASPAPIAEISENLGYSTPAHFSRAFKRWTGTSPSAYREQFSAF